MTIQSFFTVTMIIYTVISFLLIIYNIDVNKQNKLLRDEIQIAYKHSDIMLEFCLNKLLEEAINENIEDFELAQECQRLIKQLKEKRSN